LSILFFFFSSRRRHTRSKRDWSSDVCSSDLDGHPDGLCLDSAGNVWVAMHSGSQVLGLDEHGKVAERISVGATQVTACAFGGEDRGTLFITTSRENLADGDDPAAGSLFAARPGVHGPVDELLFGD